MGCYRTLHCVWPVKFSCIETKAAKKKTLNETYCWTRFVAILNCPIDAYKQLQNADYAYNK